MTLCFLRVSYTFFDSYHFENYKINSILLLSYKGGHQNPENLSNLAKIPQLVRRKLRPKSRIQTKAHRQHSLWVLNWKTIGR